jgi:hypothetical protein
VALACASASQRLAPATGFKSRNGTILAAISKRKAAHNMTSKWAVMRTMKASPQFIEGFAPTTTAIVIGCVVAGCSIIPTDPAKLSLLTAISVTRQDVMSAARFAPPESGSLYQMLETDFNGFIDATNAYITSIGQSSSFWAQVDLDIAHPQYAIGWDKITRDVTAYDIAANANQRADAQQPKEDPVIAIDDIRMELPKISVQDRRVAARMLIDVLQSKKLPEIAELKP